MNLGIQGHTAAVAAGSAGLGYAAAAALVSEGARVAICGRDPEQLKAARVRLGGDCVAISADVSTADGAIAFVESAREALGHVDILVTNAGGPPPGTFATTSLDSYGQALHMNLLSTIAMCRVAVPAMRARQWGRVVAITSIGARQPIAGLIASNTARAGATAFLKTLAAEVAADSVTINSVQPSSHATDRLRRLYGDDLTPALEGIPAGRLGDPRDFGAVVAFLCSEQASFITGTALPVDGGMTLGL